MTINCSVILSTKAVNCIYEEILSDGYPGFQ